MSAMRPNKTSDLIHHLQQNLKEQWWYFLITTFGLAFGFVRLSARSSQWRYGLVALWVGYIVMIASGQRKPQT